MKNLGLILSIFFILGILVAGHTQREKDEITINSLQQTVDSLEIEIIDRTILINVYDKKLREVVTDYNNYIEDNVHYMNRMTLLLKED